MVKVQYTVSRSKGQVGEFGSSLGERPEIVQPALQWRNEWAFNTQLAFSPNTVVETLISAFLVPQFIAIASIMTQFWQASIIYKCRWWIWVWHILTCHLTCCCMWRNYRSSGTRCNTSRIFSSDHVGCTSISQAVQLLENKELFIEVIINAAFVRRHKW